MITIAYKNKIMKASISQDYKAHHKMTSFNPMVITATSSGASRSSWALKLKETKKARTYNPSRSFLCTLFAILALNLRQHWAKLDRKTAIALSLTVLTTAHTWRTTGTKCCKHGKPPSRSFPRAPCRYLAKIQANKLPKMLPKSIWQV